MKILLFFPVIAVLVGCTSSKALQTKPELAPPTLESAVKALLSKMTTKEKLNLKKTLRQTIILNYSQLGNEIQKDLALQSSSENTELYESACTGCFCGEAEVAMAVICGSWNSLNGKNIEENLSECYIPAPPTDSSNSGVNSKP